MALLTMRETQIELVKLWQYEFVTILRKWLNHTAKL
jgi:hypothetical protein